MLNDLPEYTVDGLIGIAIINAEWANAVFYCEDANYEAVYERLLQKLCPGLKRFMVACTGGKTVTQKLAERREEILIPSFLLVDKDYDDLNGFLDKRKGLGIHYLRRYSLENYITQLDALIEVALEILSESNPRLTKKSLQNKVSDYKEYMSSLINDLEEIGRYFVVCQKHRIKIKTCKTPGSEIFSDTTDLNPSPQIWFDEFKNALNEYMLANADWMLAQGWLDAELANAFTPKCAPWGALSSSEHIVGKHLLFGALSYLDANLGTTFREMGSKELYLRILNHANLDELGYLKEAIHATLSNTPALPA